MSERVWMSERVDERAYVDERARVCLSRGRTASSRLAVSGCSGGVYRRISRSRRGYLTRRERGMSRKLHRSSFLLKGDSRQRCKKSCTRASCFFWSSRALAASWLLQ